MKKIYFPMLLALLTFTLVSCGNDDEDPADDPQELVIALGNQSFDPTVSYMVDYGAFNEFHNTDVFVSSGNINFEDGSAANGTSLFYIELFNPGTAFVGGRYNFVAFEEVVSDDRWFDISYVGFNYNNQEDEFANQFFAESGTADVSFTNNTLRVAVNLVMDNGQRLTFEYEGRPTQLDFSEFRLTNPLERSWMKTSKLEGIMK